MINEIERIQTNERIQIRSIIFTHEVLMAVALGHNERLILKHIC